MLRVIAGRVGEGKSLQVFKEIGEILAKKEMVLLITEEYDMGCVEERMDVTNNLDVFPIGPKASIPKILLTNHGSYKHIFLDGCKLTEDDLKFLSALDDYENINLTATVQLDRLAHNGLNIYQYKTETKIDLGWEGHVNVGN